MTDARGSESQSTRQRPGVSLNELMQRPTLRDSRRYVLRWFYSNLLTTFVVQLNSKMSSGTPFLKLLTGFDYLEIKTLDGTEPLSLLVCTLPINMVYLFQTKVDSCRLLSVRGVLLEDELLPGVFTVTRVFKYYFDLLRIADHCNDKSSISCCVMNVQTPLRVHLFG